MTVDRPELNFDCNLARLPNGLAERFCPLEPDADLKRFLMDAGQVSHGALRLWAFRQLRKWWSDYDAYGLLGMYRMHLLSTAQWRTLLARDEAPRGRLMEAPRGRLLDVGAGRGDVTRALLPLFGACHATEKARFLRRELSRLPVTVQPWDLCLTAVPTGERYDVIACLNVIDRVPYPKTLVGHLRAALADGGRLVVSVPLPLRPHVDLGRHTVDQEQPLPDSGDEWEDGATALVERWFTPLGLALERLSRAPYLSHLDAAYEVHSLDAALFVLRAAD